MVYRIIAGSIVAGLALVAIGQNAQVPINFRGSWASSEAHCGVSHEGSLTIYEARIDFYESRGKVLSVIEASPVEMEVEIESTGEGQTWRHVRRFLLSQDKRTLTDMTNRASPFSRVRCDK
jgi:hypothetical protein